VDAGWREVSPLGPRHVVFSRQGTAQTVLGLVTDAPTRSAPDVSRTDEQRWAIAPWLTDTKPRLGLGPYQNRAYGAAVTHRPLVCVAYALLPHLRIERHGAQGRRTQAKAADLSTATAQDPLRSLLWRDWLIDLKEKRRGQPVIEALDRLRGA
jgi:hypothetical protein